MPLLSSAIGVSGPRTIYQLEVKEKLASQNLVKLYFFSQIGLGLLELVTALVCVALCCRACCCTGPLTPRSHSHNAMVSVTRRHQPTAPCQSYDVIKHVPQFCTQPKTL